jgi:phosphoenolpyruvate carboxylase
MLRSQASRRWARAATSSLQRSQQATTTTTTQRLFLSSAKPSNGHWNARSFSSYSSFREPGSLFENLTDPLNSDKFTTQSISQDRDAPLRADVRTMGSLLGRIIQDHHGSQIFERIEEFRALAKKWRETGAGRKEESAQEAAAIFDELSTVCAKLSNEELHIVARAFTQFLGIANAAEGHHRCRLLGTESGLNALPDKSDSCGGVLKNLMEQGHNADAIYDCLTSQRVELVLTAHPTEVNRRTILGAWLLVFNYHYDSMASHF